MKPLVYFDLPTYDGTVRISTDAKTPAPTYRAESRDAMDDLIFRFEGRNVWVDIIRPIAGAYPSLSEAKILQAMTDAFGPILNPS